MALKRSRRIRKEKTKMYTISVVHILVFSESLRLGHCTGLDPEETSLTQVKNQRFLLLLNEDRMGLKPIHHRHPI